MKVQQTSIASYYPETTETDHNFFKKESNYD